MARTEKSNSVGTGQSVQRRHLHDDKPIGDEPYGDESVEFLVNDEIFYHAGGQRRDVQNLLYESHRRNIIEETLPEETCTLPEEEWERYQSERERQTVLKWNRGSGM